ncbi:hypothetical protein R1sor_027312 [Riccia sorocarpa]|uniref:histidine kinase n=1 Tax=Riccia sorocarpa TaxID=122646 RepID=A0ABD3GI32_9MARC
MEARVRDGDGAHEAERYGSRRSGLDRYPSGGTWAASSSEVDPSSGGGNRDDFGVEQGRSSKATIERKDSRSKDSVPKGGFGSFKDEWRLMEDLSQDVSRAFGCRDSSPFKDDYVIRNQTLHARRTRSLPAVSKTKPLSSSISVFQSTADLGKSILVSEEDAYVPDAIDADTQRSLNSALRKQVAKACLILVIGIAVMFLFMKFLLIAAPPMVSLKNTYLQSITTLSRISSGSTQCQTPLKAHPVLWVWAAFIVIVVSSRLVELQCRFRKTGKQPCSQCTDGNQRRCRVEEADERAARAQLAKQQFMAYVFHNIRVPFNAIVLGLGHMRATGEGEGSLSQAGEKMDLVQMMLDCAETMTSVLDDVTDMGQWEVGQMVVNKDEFSLLGVINFLSWGLKDLIDQNQISFRMNIDPKAQEILSMHNVVGDKQRIVQTLGNFLSNAIKFSHPGGKLELELTCEEIVDAKDVETRSLNLSLPGMRRGRVLPRKSSKASGSGNDLFSKAPRPRPYQKTEPEEKMARFRISVKDDGVGISAQDQLKLFEPYSFVSSGWVQKAGISGLGLSMARRFVEQVGGHIGVESEEGKGSKFHFTLPFPLVKRESSQIQEISVSSGMSTTQGPNEEHSTLTASLPMVCNDEEYKMQRIGNCTGTASCSKEKFFKSRSPTAASISEADNSSFKRRVLLVEDTQINRIILRKVLQNLNLHCDEAENGKIAVDYYKEGRTYDLILMDKEMPVMDGHEATRQIRRMGVITPIIALTGNAMPADRELFFEAGVDDFQTKPLSRDKLVQLLSKFGVESSCVS